MTSEAVMEINQGGAMEKQSIYGKHVRTSDVILTVLISASFAYK